MKWSLQRGCASITCNRLHVVKVCDTTALLRGLVEFIGLILSFPLVVWFGFFVLYTFVHLTMTHFSITKFNENGSFIQLEITSRLCSQVSTAFTPQDSIVSSQKLENLHPCFLPFLHPVAVLSLLGVSKIPRWLHVCIDLLQCLFWLPNLNICSFPLTPFQMFPSCADLCTV